jgi:prepilin-type N-terminal cleavage/methylation domain-containing protein
MMNMKLKIKGFGLIEVMVALVILAVGILGISKLQGTLIRNSSDANQRAVAVSIAQQKIDDLKSFAKLTVGSATDAVPDTWVPGIAPSLLSYAHIANNKGGTIGKADATTPFAVTVGGNSYLLSWNVANYYYTGAPLLPTTPVSAGNDIDFKQVAINVAWTAENGTSQNIVLNTVIDSYAPSFTALANNSSSGGIPPQASYTPELAPDVIDITVDTGSGTKRQTSKPLPDAVKTGQDSNTSVTFEVVSYFQDGSDYFQNRQEEFQTVDCTCSLSTSAGLSYPPGHVVWDESEKDRYDAVGNPISKATATQTGNANAVDDTCTVCCRDHHDDTASIVKYVVGTATGDHVHYKANGSVATGGNEYIESCRFKRINGVMRVFQDWNLLDLVVANRASLADGEAVQTQYNTYVTNLLKDQVESTNLAVKPPLRTPINIPLSPTTGTQLESRGIYIDQVYDTTGSLSTDYASYVADSANLDRLERVPFAEVNLTLLSIWTSASPAIVSVANDPVATISDPANNYYAQYKRGLIKGLQPAPSPGINITSTINPRNDGFTQISVNPSPATPKSDSVAVIVSGTAPSNITVSGSVSGSALPGGTKFTMTPGLPQCDLANNGSFTCEYISGSNVSISVSAYKKNTICDPAGGGSFNQTNVTSNLTGISINLTCP